MELVTIDGTYALHSGCQIHGTLTVYGALGCTPITKNGVTLYILHTEATKESYEKWMDYGNVQNFLFHTKDTDPVINERQLSSIRGQLEIGMNRLVVEEVVFSEKESDVLDIANQQKELFRCTPRPAPVLRICRPS